MSSQIENGTGASKAYMKSSIADCLQTVDLRREDCGSGLYLYVQVVTTLNFGLTGNIVHQRTPMHILIDMKLTYYLISNMNCEYSGEQKS